MLREGEENSNENWLREFKEDDEKQEPRRVRGSEKKETKSSKK